VTSVSFITETQFLDLENGDYNKNFAVSLCLYIPCLLACLFAVGNDLVEYEKRMYTHDVLYVG